MKRWCVFLCISAAFLAGCSRTDEVAELDAALAAVQREQARLAAGLAGAAEGLRMGNDLEHLRKVTGELRTVSVKELAYYRDVLARRGDPRAALQRMGHLDAAIAAAERLVIEMRKDITFGQDPTQRELTRQFDASLADLGKAVASIRAILKVQREMLLKS